MGKETIREVFKKHNLEGMAEELDDALIILEEGNTETIEYVRALCRVMQKIGYTLALKNSEGPLRAPSKEELNLSRLYNELDKNLFKPYLERVSGKKSSDRR